MKKQNIEIIILDNALSKEAKKEIQNFIQSVLQSENENCTRVAVNGRYREQNC